MQLARGIFAFYVFGTALCCPTLGRAEHLSLLDTYLLAVDNAPDIEIAKLRIDGAKARKDEALAGLFPKANLFAHWSDNKLSYETASPIYADSDYPGIRYGISIRQPLLAVADGLEVNRRDLMYQLSQDEFRVAEAELLEQVVAAYFDILMSDAEVVLLEDELSAVETQLKESQALYAKGMLPVTQVLETESRLDALTADLILANGNMAVTREVLVRFTGLRDGEPLNVRENVALLGRFADPEAAAQTALSSDPAISAAQTNVSAAEKAVQREKSRWIPDLAVTYNFQRSDVGFDNLSSPARDTSTIALDFRYPIFEGGARFARIRGVQAEYSTAVTSLRAQELDTEARARSAWLVFDAASARFLSSKQAVKSATINVTATQRAVKAGTAKHTDVLLALAQRSRAQRDLIDARFFYDRAWIELELAAGAPPNLVADTLSKAIH